MIIIQTPLFNDAYVTEEVQTFFFSVARRYPVTSANIGPCITLWYLEGLGEHNDRIIQKVHGQFKDDLQDRSEYLLRKGFKRAAVLYTDNDAWISLSWERGRIEAIMHRAEQHLYCRYLLTFNEFTYA